MQVLAIGDIEVITGRERRRRWTAEQKREIAAESLQSGVSPIMVARRYGVSSGLLYTWRQQLLCGALGAVADTKPRFVRVDVVAGHPQPGNGTYNASDVANRRAGWADRDRAVEWCEGAR